MMSDNSIQETWYSTLYDEIKLITDSSIKEWGNLVNRLGMDEKNRLEWADTFKNEVQDLMKDLILDVQQTQEALLNKIELLLKKTEELCKKLSIAMPDCGSENLGLYNEEAMLVKQVNELQNQVQKRIDELAILKTREETVCSNLGKLPKSITESPLPSEAEINEYILHIKSLEDEYIEREKTFKELKAEISEVAGELNLKPGLDFEKMVLGADDRLFTYTDVNMRMLHSFYDSVIEKKEHVRSEIAQLRERVRSLWEILSEDIQVCNSFLENHPGNSLDTLEALQAEVKRCDALKKANIKVFVEKLREEMQNLWDKCKFVPEQRTFEYFHDDAYTEDLLSLHDIQITRLRTYYEDNREIFELLEKREQLWSKMLELEERSTAPDRYKNRGGQLLKEEKERNALFKRIPKIEEKLLELTTAYEIKTGLQFLCWGETVELIIQRGHNNYENDKKLKLSARKQQRDMTITPSNMIKRTPLKPTLAPNSTHLKTNSSKRIFATPVSTTKRFKHMEEKQKNGTRTAPVKLSTSRTKLRYSTEKKKRIDRLRRLSKAMQQHKTAASTTVTNYNDFEVELSNREECRSTFCAAVDKDSNVIKLTPYKPCKPSLLHVPGDGTSIKTHKFFI